MPVRRCALRRVAFRLVVLRVVRRPRVAFLRVDLRRVLRLPRLAKVPSARRRRPRTARLAARDRFVLRRVVFRAFFRLFRVAIVFARFLSFGPVRLYSRLICFRSRCSAPRMPLAVVLHTLLSFRLHRARWYVRRALGALETRTATLPRLVTRAFQGEASTTLIIARDDAARPGL